MPEPLESIPGELTILDTVSEGLCWPRTFRDLLQMLVRYLGVGFKTKQGYRFVIEAASEPGQEDIGNTWFKIDINGNYMGHYEYIGGSWRRVYDLPPGGVVQIIGDPDNPPDGFRALDGTVGGYPNLSATFDDIGDGRKLYLAAFVGYTPT